MKRYIIDASVILNYALKKNKTLEKNLRTLFKKAQAKQVRLLAPDFIFLEIVNALRYSLKEESLAQQTLRHIF